MNKEGIKMVINLYTQGNVTATLFENLTTSLMETRQRYAMIKDNGIESMSVIYLFITPNSALCD